MEDLSLHILDIAENSVAAGAKNIEIKIMENSSKDLLTIEITDDGKGMVDGIVQRAADPFYTSRTTRKVGLGLPMLRESARMAKGEMEITSQPGIGTTVKATFELSHIDRKPIGNMADTIVALIAGNFEININYLEEKNGKKFIFDTTEIMSKYKGIKRDSIQTLSFIKKYIKDNTVF
jgi:anti-sigma regulatory factor (Ser/Thr protein kinase)